MEKIYQDICAYIDSRAEWMKERRRDFHKYAEAGWHEVRTCSIIADHLVRLGMDRVLMGSECFKADARMGLPDQDELDRVYQRALDQGAILPYAEKFRDGFTGVIGVIETGRPGPVIAFRQDIDALGVFEDRKPGHKPYAGGYSSVNDGEMHACGHDGHATVGMTVAETLMKFRDELCGTVKIVFQPAEEGVRGARGIAESGILDDVDYVIGIHMYDRNTEEDYEIGVRANEEAAKLGKPQIGLAYARNVANAKLDVWFYGKAAHAMHPESGNNALLAALAASQAIYAIPRTSLGDSRINVGQIEAGSGRNVVCDRVKVVMELRGYTQAALEYNEAYARRIIEHAAAMHGCGYEIRMMGATAAVMLDTPEFVDELAKMAREKLGMIVAGPAPGNNSEDYSFMAMRVAQHGGKSCFFHCLTEFPDVFHGTGFDIDEADLLNGAKFFCGAALHLMGR
jgi:aminobenzoyl-glutamate utilization protein A